MITIFYSVMTDNFSKEVNSENSSLSKHLNDVREEDLREEHSELSKNNYSALGMYLSRSKNIRNSV